MARPSKPVDVRKASTITFRVDNPTIAALKRVIAEKQQAVAADPFYRGSAVRTLSLNDAARGLVYEALEARGLLPQSEPSRKVIIDPRKMKAKQK